MSRWPVWRHAQSHPSFFRRRIIEENKLGEGLILPLAVPRRYSLHPTGKCQEWNLIVLLNKTANGDASPLAPNQRAFSPLTTRPDRESFWARRVQMRIELGRIIRTIPPELTYIPYNSRHWSWREERKTLRYFFCDCPVIDRARLRTLCKQYFGDIIKMFVEWEKCYRWYDDLGRLNLAPSDLRTAFMVVGVYGINCANWAPCSGPWYQATLHNMVYGARIRSAVYLSVSVCWTQFIQKRSSGLLPNSMRICALWNA